MFGFTEITGHERIIGCLKNTLAHKTTPHAYIFTGIPGVGKTLMAKSFGKALLCKNPKDFASCNGCISCRTFESGNNPDFIYVSPSKTKTIGVDDIRDMTLNLNTAPYSYAYKVFLINGKMTEEAQNALLKSIEEPPSYAVFLLEAINENEFLPTVLSRCVVLKLKPLPEPSVTAYLHRQGFSYEQSMLFSVYAQGSIGRALEISQDENFISMRWDILDVLSNLKNADLCDAFLLFRPLEIYKESIEQVLSIFYLWFRDALMIKENLEKYVIQIDMKDRLFLEAQSCSAKGLLAKGEAVAKAQKRLRSNANFQLTLELMLWEIASITN